MRDILQSRYLHSNVVHKRLARTSLMTVVVNFLAILLGLSFVVGSQLVFYLATKERIATYQEYNR